MKSFAALAGKPSIRIDCILRQCSVAHDWHVIGMEGLIVETEITAVSEHQNNKGMDSGREECAVVDLGQVSKDTQGGNMGLFGDGGIIFYGFF